jgi:protein-ribulosamine 3-kinase
MLPERISPILKQLLEDRTVDPVKINGSSPVGGGCINECFRVDTSTGAFFVKYNDANRYPGMFEAEAAGLKLLGKAVGNGQDEGNGRGRSAEILVPKVVAYGGDGQHGMLVLEFLESGKKGAGFWEGFGIGLANLHRVSDGGFGLDRPNYIGSLPQSNSRQSDWPGFFIEERLEAQLKLARDFGRAGRDLVKGFEGLYPRLVDFFPKEPPALLHGDLWSGNFMVAEGGKAAIVDPAVYYGHRYMDLGMSQLFGGFAPAFYAAYDAAFPLEKNWVEGTEVANLYPLLVHLNLFGAGYLGSIQSVLRKFG